MKVCPVCKSHCFEDMDICYGCMYHFAETLPMEADIVSIPLSLSTSQDTGEKTPVTPCPSHTSFEVAATAEDTGSEEILARYQLVISFKPVGETLVKTS